MSKRKLAFILPWREKVRESESFVRRTASGGRPPGLRNRKNHSAGQRPAPTCCTFLVSFAYVLGQILSIFAYDLGRKRRFFAYDLGKHCTFAKNESYDIQTINRRFREVESAF